MPESQSRRSDKVKVKPQRQSRLRTPSTDGGHTAPGPAAGMEESQHPWESLLGSDFSQAAFQRHAALLGDNRMSRPMYAQQRALIVQQLQRDYGNRYVQRLVDHIQRQRSSAFDANHTVGPAGDKYEQEADRVAKQVVGQSGSTSQEPVQRQEPQERELAQSSYPSTAEAPIGPWNPNQPAYTNARPIPQVVQRHWDKTETDLTPDEITERKTVDPGNWNAQYTGAAKAGLNAQLQAGLASAQAHADAAEDGMPWLKAKRKTKKGTTPVYSPKHFTLAKKQWGAVHNNNGGLLPGVAGAGGYMEYYAEPSPNAAEYWVTHQKQPLGKNRILKQTNVVGATYWWASTDHYNSVTFINDA